MARKNTVKKPGEITQPEPESVVEPELNEEIGEITQPEPENVVESVSRKGRPYLTDKGWIV